MTIYLTALDEHHTFPSPHDALIEPNGLLAFGGDLQPQRILKAYHQGIFPWFSPGEPILWWSPAPRAIFDPKTFTPSKSLKKFQRKHQYRVSMNHATNEVIRLCAALRPTEETWITDEMQSAYQQLAQLGHCHSVEVWHENELVGGLYGLAIGKIFCGESMFSQKDNASKIALWLFCKHFTKYGGELIDCQVMNPHLQSLGAQELSRSQFLAKLQRLREQTVQSNTYQPQWLEN